MRPGLIKRGMLGLIIGLILAGFGWADYEYRLTDLPGTIDDLLYGTGILMAVIGFGYLVYGFIKKAPTPDIPTYTTSFSQSPPPPPQSHSTTRPSNIPPPPQPSPNPKFCTECGQPLRAGIRFCGNCGTQLAS